MLNNTPFYWGIIRKSIVAFGNMFSNIHIERREGDSVTGTKVQTIQVPISYSPKEKWIVRIDQDPNLENHTYITLPRMAFEITNYSYDSSRKMQKMQKILCNNGGTTKQTFSPVPWNVDISLYILTKTQEDALQILEQILPTFGPEYTVTINAVPDINVKQDIPFTLTGVSVSDEYDGDFTQRRFVLHTLTFTLKLNLFNAVNDAKVIYTAKANLENIDEDGQSVDYRGYTVIGDPDTHEIISEMWEDF